MNNEPGIPSHFGTRSRDYDHALELMNTSNPDVRKSFALLQAAHAEGDPRATYALATWYLHGQAPVAERDTAKARCLLEAAAAARVPDALYDLGVYYERGEDGAADPSRAFRNYLQAALRGDRQSVYEVGRCYHYGIGTTADEDTAVIWLDRAAELGVGK
jgi:uncharacterized protein